MTSHSLKSLVSIWIEVRKLLTPMMILMHCLSHRAFQLRRLARRNRSCFSNSYRWKWSRICRENTKERWERRRYLVLRPKAKEGHQGMLSLKVKMMRTIWTLLPMMMMMRKMKRRIACYPTTLSFRNHLAEAKEKTLKKRGLERSQKRRYKRTWGWVRWVRVRDSGKDSS